MIRFFYSLLVYFLLPFTCFKLIYRGFRQPDYLKYWSERYGFYSASTKKIWDARKKIWIHAVSVGETKAAIPLIKLFLKKYPRHYLLITHGTPTGRATSIDIKDSRISRIYLPFDTPDATKRFLSTFKPEMGLLLETELWFNLIHQGFQKSIPLYLVNARLSEKSFQLYKRISLLVKPSLQELKGVLAQTRNDAKRFEALGAKNVEVMGNLKFDVTPPRDTNKQSAALKKHLHLKNQSVLLIASSRQGEEEIILQHLLKLRYKNLVTIFVPRHPQRFKEVELMLKKYRASFIKRSDKKIKVKPYQFILGDSMGEMYSYYTLANIALMGGTILPYGGQNLIESMAMKVPVILGPHTYNFHDVSNEAIRTGAGLRIHTLNQLEKVLPQMLKSSSQLKMKQACSDMMHKHKGATLKILNKIKSMI
ncbi:3-deoxy-D-manno-octulosonic acid transferase [Candidatus Methylopumilus planktonicus]|uniref:3-deoxy-D-manno-octulosonic acid transferase n=1 Tax=Candidatus Methylopumilus planktonicus TaxID=1581557 RepID=UPI00111E6F15|nr:3-deoxy-D-manno-octulosonic acid transferase [Candidatus Methylopumilus planktonicus]QDD02208.1 3-deoxy-D-manno-octulosonic acid transferase [Candidatus Methylopumilus planktonicus]